MTLPSGADATTAPVVGEIVIDPSELLTLLTPLALPASHPSTPTLL
jgi:hypothetical protein